MTLNKVRYVKYLTLFFCLLMMGCSSSESLLKEAQDMGEKCGFKSEKFQAQSSDIMVFLRPGDPYHIHVYLEGDGFAWFNKYEIAQDPTPEDPMGLKIACEDQSQATVVFLTRPCHYGLMRGCSSVDWTFGRFGQKIVNVYGEVLDSLKVQNPGVTFRVYGYSGGAFLALLLAQNRLDITHVTTFAGLLDHAAWTQYQGYSPLTSSLSLKDFEAISNIKQVHYVGMEDREVPFSLSKTYQSHFKDSSEIQFIPIKGYGHTSDWPAVWKRFQN